MGNIWNEEFERLPRERLRQLQSERLGALIARVYERVPYYKGLMDGRGVTPGDIKGVDDLHKLPFTTKEDLRKNYPFGMFTVPLDEVVRIHASSGTTGKPTVVGYTRNDIAAWAEVMARSLSAAGVKRGDVVQNAYGYGLFTGGLGAHYGAETIGASVIPISGGQTKRQIMIMQDFGSTVLCATPSYTLNIADVMQDMGIDMSTIRLRVGVFGAEPWSEAMRDEIERRMNIKAIDIYGMSELIGPGVACECIEEAHGLHVFEDHFIVETIDPDTGDVLEPGSKGELVFTTVTKEAFPVIRYRSKDIARLITEPCSCGRTFHRMERVTGRSDDMLIIRGVNVFPSQIESVLMGIEEVEPHYQIVVDREASMDVIRVEVEVSEDVFSDEVKRLEGLRARIQGDIKDLLGVTCTVRLVEPKGIQRSEGKARRVIDNRKL